MLRVLVPLDGSALAEEALEPAIFLSRVFSAPVPGMLHLACVVPLSEPEMLALTERNAAIHEAQAYLSAVEQRVGESEPHGTSVSVYARPPVFMEGAGCDRTVMRKSASERPL